MTGEPASKGRERARVGRDTWTRPPIPSAGALATRGRRRDPYLVLVVPARRIGDSVTTIATTLTTKYCFHLCNVVAISHSERSVSPSPSSKLLSSTVVLKLRGLACELPVR